MQPSYPVGSLRQNQARFKYEASCFRGSASQKSPPVEGLASGVGLCMMEWLDGFKAANKVKWM